MNAFPDLEAFLRTLRAEGLTIGPREVIWLHHIFRQSPTLDRERLRVMLGCVLAKTPAQRRRFDVLFELWFGKVSESPAGRSLLTQTNTNSTVSREEPTKQGPTPEPQNQKPRSRWRQAIAALLEVGVLLFLMQFLISLPHHPLQQPTVIPVTPIKPKPATDSSKAEEVLPHQPTELYWAWVPIIETPSVSISTFWPQLGLGLACLILSGWLWRRYQDAVRLPEGLPPPAPGPDLLPLLPPESMRLELLNNDQARHATWSVDRFVSEKYTEKLDLPKTVEATARAAGIAKLRHQKAVYDREVWLWIDEQSEEPALLRLARELQSSLQRAGLTVHIGWFYALPYRLTWEQGHSFDPLVWEGHRGSVIVAILTDGQGLLHAWQAAYRRPRLHRLLYSLGQWPRLGFVEFSQNQRRLPAILDPYAIPCISPNELPAFLGEFQVSSGAMPSSPQITSELRLWEAAACLDGGTIDEATALALHRHLEIGLPPLVIQSLWRSGSLQTGRLNWSAEKRARYINWLSGTEQLTPSKPVPATSLLGRALTFWRQRYAREREQRQKRETELKPWRNSQADRELQLKQVLIDLWDRPEGAADRLYALFEAEDGGAFRETIKKTLSRYIPSDLYTAGARGPRDIRLPWDFHKLSAKARYLLSKMKMADGRLKPRGQIRPTGRLGLTLGTIAGLGVAAIGISLITAGTTDMPRFQATDSVFEHPVFRRFTIREWRHNVPNQYRYVAGSPKGLVSGVAAAGQVLSLDWHWKELPNIDKLDGAQLWHAGTLPQPIRACAEKWPRRSLAVIAADADNDIAAQQLAIRLLDRGAADVVLLGSAWEQHLERLTGGAQIASKWDRLLIILPAGAQRPTSVDFPGAVAAVSTENFEALARSLDFPGVRSVGEVWGGDSDLLLWGGPEVEEVGSMEMVKVCGGTFSMGSPKDEIGSFDNEHPRHPVTLDSFTIGRTEVTEAQYKAFKPLQQEYGASMPAIDITWDEAQAFCQDKALELPTEAQWEYAARAGTLTLWSSGNSEAELKDFAWFGEGYKGNAHPVAEKRPNPLGLYDMHGNAWEGVLDCYQEDIYKQRDVEKPTIDLMVDKMACQYRSLRGGSFFNSAQVLRSAYRSRYEPVRWARVDGFRCVRGPRRQP
jgi:formylglycine-generating enzyme required for sulfatase activity